MEPIPETEWKRKRLDKSQYAVKRTTKVETEGGTDIMKQEWIVTDCEKARRIGRQLQQQATSETG